MTNRAPNIRRDALAYVMLLVALPASLAACNQRPSSELPAAANQERPGTPAAAKESTKASAQVADVTLNEFVIEMPSTLKAGTYTLDVKNAGQLVHTLRMSGPGVDQGLGRNLKPDEEGELTVMLKPGTYEVWCPIAQHAARGMKTTLSVT